MNLGSQHNESDLGCVYQTVNRDPDLIPTADSGYPDSIPKSSDEARRPLLKDRDQVGISSHKSFRFRDQKTNYLIGPLLDPAMFIRE